MRGQDYAVDLCGVLDVLRPVILLMLRTQAVNIPPWKIVTWYSRVIEILKSVEEELKKVKEGAKPLPGLLKRLSEHWDELNNSEEENDDDCGTFQLRKAHAISAKIQVII